MKKLTSNQWDKIERNPFNSFKKIGWYNQDRNSFEEVARWRNTYGTTGANFGMLNIWSPLFDAHFFESQPGRNSAGGYNKPIANLEGCLYQLKKAVENGEIVSEGQINYSNCGSVDSLMKELMEYLQRQFKVKLFILDIC